VQTFIESEDFINLFNSPGNTVEIADMVVTEDIGFTKVNYNCEYAILNNIKFEGSITFDNIDIGKGIKFQNCSFQDLLVISNIKAAGKHGLPIDTFYNLTFDNCSVPRLILPQSNFLEYGMVIRGECKIGGIIIQNLSASYNGINIENSSLTDKLQFSNIKLNDGSIRLKSSKINCRIKIENLNAFDIVFIENEIKRDIFIWGGKCKSGIIFNDGIFSDDVTITSVKANGILTVTGSDFKKILKMELDDVASGTKGNIGEVFISDVKFGNGFILNGFKKEIQKVLINASPNLTGTIKFENCLFIEANLNGDNHKGNIIFISCQFKRIEFNHFVNYGNILLSSCKAISSSDSEFNINFSNLGKTQFFNFFFDSFDKVNILDSHFSEITTTGVTWFKNNVLNISNESNSDAGRKKMDIFRQLKQASEKQGDKIQALEFQAFELKAFKQHVNLKESFWSNDRMILWLSQTNNFGINWWKPLLLVVGITFLFYILIAIDIAPNLHWRLSFIQSDIKGTLGVIFIDKAYIFPQLFNPARAIDRMLDKAEVNLSAFLYFLDALHRIILTFFIVQIVSTFRKFIK